MAQHNDVIKTDKGGNRQSQKIMLKFGHWSLSFTIHISFPISKGLHVPDSLVTPCTVHQSTSLSPPKEDISREEKLFRCYAGVIQ